MKPSIKSSLSLLSLMLAFASSAGIARANVAANTQITNKATLTFSGGSASASVVVTVALVPSTPNISITYASGAYTAPDTPVLTDSVIVTATANGPANYTITPVITASTNVLAANPASVNIGGSPSTTVSIGASVTTGSSGANYLTVPAATASGSNAAVNGIGVGSTVIFTVNGNSYTRQVTGTTDNGDGTFRLGFATTLPAADIPPAGILVAEQKTVYISVKPGTVATSGTNLTVTVKATASTANANPVSATTATPNTWTTPTPSVSLTKYVRNVSASSTGAGATTFTINSVTNTYYTSGVTGKPGDTLEYVLLATNSGAADLSGCAISDAIPTSYVKFATGPYNGRDVFYSDAGNITFTFIAGAVGTYQASYVAPNLIVNVGTGAGSTTSGTIPAGKSVTVAYQVTINR